MDPLGAVQQHLEAAIAAYGSDLPLAAGERKVVAVVRGAPPPPPRAAAPAPTQAAPPRPTLPPPIVRTTLTSTAPPRPPTFAAPTAAPTPVALSQPAAAPKPAATTIPTDPATAFEKLRAEVLACTKCKLCKGRENVVFGEGNPSPQVMFVGEAPGAVEDQTGRPFVGPAGQLLDRIIAGAMGLRREDVYIGNINKCRPPDNRPPEPDEVAACLPFLRRQMALLRPQVIVALGGTAAHNLLGRTESVTRLRGVELKYEGIPVVVTWHPAYLLRDPSHKRETWDDIKRVNRILGRPEVPPTAAPSA